jgi:hypothetical protein
MACELTTSLDFEGVDRTDVAQHTMAGCCEDCNELTKFEVFYGVDLDYGNVGCDIV